MKKSYFHLYQYCTTVIPQNIFKWQYMAVAGDGAGAEIMDKGGAGAEKK